MIVTCSINLSKFQCTIFEKLVTITYIHFYFFSIFVHPLAKMFYGEIHKDDGNMIIFLGKSKLPFERYG